MKSYRGYIIYLIIISLISLIVVIEYNSFKNNRGIVRTELKAQQGILDLTDWDFVNYPLHSLDGEWLFFYQQFVMPDKEDGFSSVISIGGKTNSHTFESVRRNFLLPNPLVRILTSPSVN